VVTCALALSGAVLAGYAPGSPAADAAADYEAVTSEPGVLGARPPSQTAAATPAQPEPEPDAFRAVPAAYRVPVVHPPSVPSTRGTARGAKVVRLASLQAGKPYVYGAAGPRSFDCSGFVQYVYKKLGKTLPRTTNQQYAATARVPRGSQRPGDLIFFGKPGAIYHTGIYAGGGKIWVAPKTGDVVKLQRIWSPSYLVGRVR
jgi:cell wall-associated NlpC family hydrolase